MKSDLVQYLESAAVRSLKYWLRLMFGRGTLYLGAVLLCVAFGFPVFWTLMSSFKTAGEMHNLPIVIMPKVLRFQNYVDIFTIPRIPVLIWVWNSVTVTALATLGTVITAAIVGYGFARFEFRGRDALFFVTLATMMLPAQVTLIPQFILFNQLGWINTLLPLWVPYWFGGGGFSIFLMRQFIRTLPRDLDEAAVLDGASFPRIFWSILLPLCKPVLATLAIISVVANWGDYLGPLIFLNSPEKFTAAIGLHFFITTVEVGGEPMEHILMAACILTMLPVTLVFFLGQRYFVQGIAMSGIKG